MIREKNKMNEKNFFKRIVGKIFALASVLVIICGSAVLAFNSGKPTFSYEKIKMRLGTTQKLSAITNIDASEYSKIENSNPSVVVLQENGYLKALSTGITTLTYTYPISETEEKKVWCYIEVWVNQGTFEPINGETSSKINVKLHLGEYTARLKSPKAAVPTIPSIEKEGYILEGLYKEPEFLNKLGENERLNQDVDLYAKWITAEEAEKPVIAHSELYDDIDTHWARNYIETVSYRNLFQGVAERRFGPDETMTRGMVITVLGRLDGVEKSGRTTNFSDVEKGSYYEEYIAWGVENGIVEGTSKNEFSPNKVVNREEMALMMANYVKYKKYKYEINEVYFSDVDDISSWALESVKILNDLGIMRGNADGSYSPKKVATRAEIATIFYNYLNFINI